MKSLLIVGADGHGRVVAEIAEDLGYEKTNFLNDNSPQAIGKISELEKFVSQYRNVFVRIGDNGLRDKLIQKLQDYGYMIPVLVHPTAYISRTLEIDMGTVIELNAIVNANSHIGESCIILLGVMLVTM